MAIPPIATHQHRIVNGNRQSFHIRSDFMQIDSFRAFIYRPKQEGIPIEVISEGEGRLGDLLSLDIPVEQGLFYQIFGFRNGVHNSVVGLYGSAMDLRNVAELLLIPREDKKNDNYRCQHVADWGQSKSEEGEIWD